MILVTGGAGFIGSCIVAALNEAGRNDIAVNDFMQPRTVFTGSDQTPERCIKRIGKPLAQIVEAADSFTR